MTKTEVVAVVERCSVWDGYTFDPGTYLDAVNSLRDEAPSFVLDALSEYLDAGGEKMIPGSTRIFFLLRLLFVPDKPGGRFPPVGVGKPLDVDLPPIENFPLYPLVVIKDMPLLMISGFFLGGLPRDPREEIEFCKNNCRLRPQPLHPPDNPLPLVESLMSSETWYHGESEHDLGMLRAQVLRAVRTVYTLPGIDEPDYYIQLTRNDVWQQCNRTFAGLNAVWNREKNEYTL